MHNLTKSRQQKIIKIIFFSAYSSLSSASSLSGMRSNQAELQAPLEITAQNRKQLMPVVLSNNLGYRRKGREEQRVCFDFDISGKCLKFSGIVLRKEVIQPQVLLRLPCYDFTPVVNNSLGACFPKVGSATSALVGSHGVTGGVYKARERIHRGVLIRDY